MRFLQSFRKQIDVAPIDRIEAMYRYDAALPKACIHPLVTPGGVTLSGFERSDHVWHRGLWFTIKFVNGENFWEEHAPLGVQQSVCEPSTFFGDDGSVRVLHGADWTSEATGCVLFEKRKLTFLNPTGHTRTIDFATELVAQQDLTLDRTPYTTWGRHSGLSFRGSRELHDATFETPDGERVKGIAGQRHEWIVMRARVDGGANRGIAMGVVDHRSNDAEPGEFAALAKPFRDGDATP